MNAREDLAAVIQRIQAYLPGFMAEELGYPDVAAAASPERPLVYLLTTLARCPQQVLRPLPPAGRRRRDHVAGAGGDTDDGRHRTM